MLDFTHSANCSEKWSVLAVPRSVHCKPITAYRDVNQSQRTMYVHFSLDCTYTPGTLQVHSSSSWGLTKAGGLTSTSSCIFSQKKSSFVACSWPVHNQDIRFQLKCPLCLRPFITAESGCSTMYYTAAVVH